VLGRADLRASHVAALVGAAAAANWDGIDIDYENLQAGDRTAVTAFLTQLAAALHRSGKVLTVTVPAITAVTEPDDAAAQAFDVAAIGRVVDEIRVMAYDHAWATSPPGAVAPLPWVRDVVDYLAPLVPASKLVLGLAAYGYDWSGGRGEALTTTELQGLAGRVGATVRRDAAGSTPWFQYVKDGVDHTVWFEDAVSSRAKIRLAADAGLAGVVVWRLGGEDRELWPLITSPARSPSPPPGTPST
jgi:spore germination protein